MKNKYSFYFLYLIFNNCHKIKNVVLGKFNRKITVEYGTIPNRRQSIDSPIKNFTNARSDHTNIEDAQENQQRCIANGTCGHFEKHVFTIEKNDKRTIGMVDRT